MYLLSAFYSRYDTLEVGPGFFGDGSVFKSSLSDCIDAGGVLFTVDVSAVLLDVRYSRIFGSIRIRRKTGHGSGITLILACLFVVQLCCRNNSGIVILFVVGVRSVCLEQIVVQNLRRENYKAVFAASISRFGFSRILRNKAESLRIVETDLSTVYRETCGNICALAEIGSL